MDSGHIINSVSAIAIIFPLLAFWPFYFATMWIFQLSLVSQIVVGVAVGLAFMASLSIAQLHRSEHRASQAISVAQVAFAEAVSLRRLWSNASDTEQVRWLNAGLIEIWPIFKEASSGLVQLKLQSVLNRYKFGAIQEVAIEKIDLGMSNPYVQGIKASKVVDDETSLEIQMDWRHNEDQEMILNVRTSGPEYTVQVRHFVIYAVLKLTFKPLKEEFPGFAAMVFSIVEPPLVDFQTKILEGDLKKLPEMRTAVDNLLLSTLMDLLVWPSRIVVPFISGDYSYLTGGCVGHLHVGLLEARDLANKELTGISNPYVMLFVRRRQDSVKESTRMRDVSTPVWNENFVFNIEDPAAQKLTVKVMNTDDTNVDNCIGTMEFPIHQLDANIQKDIWMNMVGDPTRLRGKIAGQVHFLLEFKPASSDRTEWHEVREAGNEGYASPELVNKMNMETRILEGTRFLNDADVENHAITAEKMLSDDRPRDSDAELEKCSPSGLRLFSEDARITGNVVVHNHALKEGKMLYEAPVMENSALAAKAKAVSGEILQDSECKQVLDGDSCNRIHSTTQLPKQSHEEVDSAKQGDLHGNQVGLLAVTGSSEGIEMRDDYPDKSGPMDMSRNFSLENGNPDQTSLEPGENHHGRRSNEFADKYWKLTHEDMFASEIYEVD